MILIECRKCEVEKKPSEYMDGSDLCKECSVTHLNVDAIRDFQVCSLFYNFRYIEEEPEITYANDILAQRFNDLLRRLVTFYFHKKQSGITPSYNAILNKWERYWFPSDTDAYDIAMNQNSVVRNNLTALSTSAAVGLLKLYEDFEDITIDPMLINEPFHVPLVDGVILDGSFDLVYRQQDKFSVVKFSTGRRRPSGSKFDFDMASLYYSWNHRTNGKYNTKYFLYDLGSSNPGFMSVDIDLDLVKQLGFWAELIHETKLFYPRRGLTTYCKNCPFDKQCADWKPGRGNIDE